MACNYVETVFVVNCEIIIFKYYIIRSCSFKSSTFLEMCITKLIFDTVLKLLKLIFSSVKVCIFADLSLNWACKS